MLSKIITIISNFNLVLYSSSSLVSAKETDENDVPSPSPTIAPSPTIDDAPKNQSTQQPESQTVSTPESQTEPPAGSGNDDKEEEKEKMKKNKKAGDIIGKITTQPEFLKAEGDKELTSLNGKKIPKGETWVEFAFTFNGDYEDKYDLSTISFNKMGKKEDKYDDLSISMLLETNNPLITSKTNDKKLK